MPANAYWHKNYVLNFKKHKFDFRDTWKERQKPSVTKTFSAGFNHDAELPYNSKDKAFLDEVFVKQSSILIRLENFEATGFFIMGGLGWLKRVWATVHEILAIKV